ncbi:MAG: DegT/DnrJ/EryC1/StrS family aminotransferase, partial [Bacteroidota bacterium]
MEVPFVDIGNQYKQVKGDIQQAIESVFEEYMFIGGHFVSDFEEKFAESTGVKHVVGCANGTDAIEIALETLGITEGDEVLVPAYSFVSTATAVKRVGAEPVFVDVHEDYYTINHELIKNAITKNTRAIIAVHFYGLPAPMHELMDIAREHNLFVVEDCAQGHGAQIDKQQVGSFGDMATYSFYPSKNFGAYGDAGAILTNDDELAEKARIISNMGQLEKHKHLQVGRNSRLDTLQAAILQAKLPKVEEWTARRRWVARQYNIKLPEFGYKLQRIPDNYKHVYHLYVIQTENRDRLKEFLEDNGVQTQIHYPKPLNQFNFFKNKGKMTVANEMSEKILSLPMYP